MILSQTQCGFRRHLQEGRAVIVAIHELPPGVSWKILDVTGVHSVNFPSSILLTLSEVRQ